MFLKIILYAAALFGLIQAVSSVLIFVNQAVYDESIFVILMFASQIMFQATAAIAFFLLATRMKK